tara:strand:- start:5547 stop:6590 length:1044 start_codon:yes stop_codon:yes gene_type:complete
MALQSSGAISLSQIQTEFGGTAPTSLSEYYAAADGIPNNNNPLSFSDFYGTSSNIDLDTVATPVVINGQNSLQEITVSDYISSGGQLTIPSGWWIWSDNTSNAGMTIDIPCTIINNGYIIGRGGNGAGTIGYNGTAGGPAIRINSGVSGVTITNNASAFIAGGGGGGATQNSTSQRRGGGGGGAGGGTGGIGVRNNGSAHSSASYQNGAVLNAAAAQGVAVTSQTAQAGGVGGYVLENSSGSEVQQATGSGGGRILPGNDCNPTVQFITQFSGNIATGGAGGQNGGNGRRSGDTSIGAGGGGWGASGGNGASGRSVNGTGGAGGKAVEDTGNTYTLINNGTMFGATT